MTKEQIQLVKRSWRLLGRIDPVLIGGVFYEKLFTDAPTLKRLFKNDVAEQAKKLVDMLTSIVAQLDTDCNATEQLEALAQRHRLYGVKPEQYKTVGAALLWTLQQAFGDEWDAETENAWRACYSHITAVMLQLQ